MRPLNRQQRRGAILKFIILYLVTFALILLPFFFMGKFVDQQNEKLKDDIDNCRADVKLSKVPRGWHREVEDSYERIDDISRRMKEIHDEMHSSLKTDYRDWSEELNENFVYLVYQFNDFISELDVQKEKLKEIIPPEE